MIFAIRSDSNQDQSQKEDKKADLRTDCEVYPRSLPFYTQRHGGLPERKVQTGQKEGKEEGSCKLSRTTLLQWVKSCRKSFILQFYDLTRPLSDFVGKKLKISIDEHVVARWTRKVEIPGTKYPTKGKAMKADKLF